jgi:asparagine synthase (glutamine-hydrolysing)
MCGLAGSFDPRADRGADELLEIVASMAQAVNHRGPDDRGTWIDAAAGFAVGHARLAILDPSPDGRQPMASSCGRWVVAYNGETYNYLELRDRLAAGGRRFHGRSDTEVLVEAISAWGVERAVRACEGMLALAAWDREERALWLARDRVGKKPLYVGRAGRALVFGSELEALRRHPGFRTEIDRGALTLFLRHACVPAPYCIYQNAKKLRPGTLVRITAGDLSSSDGCDELLAQATLYWSARDAVAAAAGDPFAGDEQEAVLALDRLLRDAVRRRMVSDVPLGAFLSGGVDSSLVVALMQAQSDRPVRTFTIGFHESSHDEAEDAARVARHLGCDHTELYVTPGEAMAVIPRLPAIYDEPFADSSQIPTFLVSRLARREVTVALSGDGGDELFCGYNRHAWVVPLWRRFGRAPRSVRRKVASAMTWVSPSGWDAVFRALDPVLPQSARQRNPGYKIHKLAGVLDAEDVQEMYRGLASHWAAPAEVSVSGSEPPTLFDTPEAWPRLDDPVERMMFLDLVTYLYDDILVKVDRASMAVSLEARNPLLDHRVLSFAWRLPLEMKLRDGRGKWILRELLGRYVPAALVDRPKSGFGIPLREWLLGPLRDWAESLLDERRLAREGWLRPAPIRRRWAELLEGTGDWQCHIWDVLMFQAWLEAASRRPAGQPLGACVAEAR